MDIASNRWLLDKWISELRRLPVAFNGRAPFYLAVVWGACLSWMAPHLPLTDLPQHAGQIALLRDLILGQSHWTDIVQLNLFTPYVVCYGLGALLSIFMSVHAALSLLLSVAFVAFVLACVEFRRDLSGDPRIDWLFIPGFFGLAWKWGFVSYLVACPIGVYFLIVSRRYAMRAGPRRGGWLIALGVALFFSHALVFLFALSIGFLYLVSTERRPFPRWISVLIPYAVLGVLAATYQLFVISNDPTTDVLSTTSWGDPRSRLGYFFLYPWGATQADGYMLLCSAAVLAALLLLNVRVNRSVAGWWAPIGVLLVTWAFAPSRALKTTSFLFERFAVFTLPCVAWSLASGPHRASHRVFFSRVAVWVLGLACYVQLGVTTLHTLAFVREVGGADQIIASIPRGKLLFYFPVDSGSDGAHWVHAYLHYALWYQAERDGFVDPNFAGYLPQIVRFRRGAVSAVHTEFQWIPAKFDWQASHASSADYFLVRGQGSGVDVLLQKLTDNGECAVRVLQRSGKLTLLGREGRDVQRLAR